MGMLALVFVVVVTKVVAYAPLLHHPVTVYILFGLTAAVALRHGRLIWTAISGAVMLPVALSPASVGVGIAIGVGSFIALMVLFVVIGTVLNAAGTRETRRRDARRVPAGAGA